MKKRLVLAAMPFCLAMCASVQPYKDALYRYGVAGQHIIEDVPAPTTEGGKARLEAFQEACTEAVKLGGEK